MKKVTVEIEDDEILVALKKPENYNDTVDQIFVEDALITIKWLEWRMLERKKKPIEYFGKGCEYAIPEWENQHLYKNEDYKKTCKPISICCNHIKNIPLESRCGEDICPKRHAKK